MTDRSSTGTRTRPGVYPPREDSLLLLPFARVAAGTSLLEVGAGLGVASLAAARSGARVVATDLNLEALRRLRAAARAERLDVSVVRTDLANGLRRFDRVLANPPYLPTRPEERDPDRGTNLALDGGPDGCRVLARLLESLPDHLVPGASAYVVGSSLQNGRALAALEAAWRRRGGKQEVVAERSLEGERLVVWRFGLGGRAPTHRV
jgi:release factor glutamine methyltransferase